MTTPWVEKYRPTDLDVVVGNSKVVRMLANLLDKDVSIPNLLICEPSGSGKTTCVDIVCDTIIRNNPQAKFLRSSSFEERGIDYVRSTVKNFAKERFTNEYNPNLRSRPSKIVVLDEADSISPGAFQALRRIMEAFSNTTRFIVVCNNSTKIIEPIQSRCAILRFSKVEEAAVCSRMSQICDMAGVEYDVGGIRALACVADGDVRSAINSLSSTVSAFDSVTERNVYRTCDSPQPAKIEEILDLLRSKANYTRACRKLKDVVDDGYHSSDIVSTFFSASAHTTVDREHVRLELAKVIGLTQARVLNGASSYLQLAAMLWGIAEVLSGKHDRHDIRK